MERKILITLKIPQVTFLSMEYILDSIRHTLGTYLGCKFDIKIIGIEQVEENKTKGE